MKFFLMWANHTANTMWDKRISDLRIPVWNGAVDRKIFKKVMPIPRSIPVVSQWIGIIATFYGKVKFVDIPLMYCRVAKSKHSAFEYSFRGDGKGRAALVSKLYKRIISGN